MKALVLCDGSEGSLRSIEVACAGAAANTSSLMPSKESSLILAHLWDTPEMRTNAVSASCRAADTYAPRRSTVSPAAATGGLGNSSMPCADVVTETLRYIHTNKYLKDRLHYTMETACASAVWARDNADRGALGDAVAGPAGGAAASQAAHGKAGQAQKRASCWAGAGTARHRSDQRPQQKQADTAVEAFGGSSNSAGTGVAPEAPDAAGSTPENEKRAIAVVKYATARAKHHNVTAILLGVGQRQEGKVCALGSVAQRVLLELHSAYPLYYVKKDGVKWRPGLATATVTASAPPVRFTIVVAVPADTRWESNAVMETRCGDEEAAPQSSTSISELSAAPPQVPKDVQAAVGAAVQYVENRCVRLHAGPQVDQIAFAVIATSSSQDGDNTTEPDRSEDGGGVPAGSKGNLTRISPLEAYKRYLEALPVIKRASDSPAAATALPLLPASSISTAVSREHVIEPPRPEGGGAATVLEGNAKTAPAPRATASLVTVCALKASKKSPFLSLDATPELALSQIVKQVGALKPEVLVLPTSLVPESLQLALLSASTPHCVVLPF
ncbi:hypothetical protein GH5_06598 [Leishmania sp. Ghana 2012 LV757]|uniref:hypothetical protein n=1 Tax=Leishmania sp. Ghana 2012 LV757 TaxID=2803181 RepID=UPI001B51D8E7|nr:hypothetical protein GH5_06598 [Leishmania sp. Ghana 2012 LV757]